MSRNAIEQVAVLQLSTANALSQPSEERGTPLSFAEDVGRHNALDKPVGRRLLARLPTAPVAAPPSPVG